MGGGVVGKEKKTGDKPNYLLRIQRKCAINCGGPEENRRAPEPLSLNGVEEE